MRIVPWRSVRPWPVGTLCLGVLTALVVSPTAIAAGLLTVDDREMVVGASVTEGFNGTGVGPTTFTPAFGAPYNVAGGTGLVESFPTVSAEAEASFSHNSGFVFDSPNVFSSLSAEGTAKATGTLNAFANNSDAQSEADSVFDIQFTLDTPMAYSITASILDEGSGSTARVRLRPVGGADIFILQGTGTFNDVMDSGPLPAGDYQLIGEAKVAGFVTTSVGGSFFDRDAEFALQFNLIPEPATGLLLLMGSALCIRRR
jgi:hypothetical protein